MKPNWIQIASLIATILASVVIVLVLLKVAIPVSYFILMLAVAILLEALVHLL